MLTVWVDSPDVNPPEESTLRITRSQLEDWCVRVKFCKLTSHFLLLFPDSEECVWCFGVRDFYTIPLLFGCSLHWVWFGLSRGILFVFFVR